MPSASALRALAGRGLIAPDLAEQAERLGRGADLGEPLPLDDLLALAEIDQADIARAAEAWREDASLPGLLDARPVTGVPRP